MKNERAPTKPDYQRLTMLVNRIAVGMASNNGDPILAETRIISESIAPTIGWAEGERIPRATIAIDAKGGEYFAYVRGDGRGQIEIEWPNGTTTTLKFWPPESYLGSVNPSGDGGVTPIVSAAEAAAKEEAASRDAASQSAVL